MYGMETGKRHIVEYELWNKIVYFMTDYINGETVWG